MLRNPSGSIAISRRIVWLLAMVAGVAGAVAYMLLTAAQYRVRASVMYLESDAQSGQMAALMSRFASIGALSGFVEPTGGSERARAMAVLASRELALEFAKQRDLLPALYPERWNADTRQWIESVPGDWEVAERLQKKVLKVATDAKTEVTTVAVTWPDPAHAARIANEYVDFANARLRQSAIAENEAALTFLDKELASAGTVELREAVARISEARLKSLMLARISGDFAFKNIDRAVEPARDTRFRPSLMIAMLLAAGLAIAVLAAGYLLSREPGSRSRN
ncbi:MAG: hypothetical protein ACT4UP_05510 [Gammaproteobacteria bacterium]